jgi:hypothetical protein
MGASEAEIAQPESHVLPYTTARGPDAEKTGHTADLSQSTEGRDENGRKSAAETPRPQTPCER